MGAALAAIKCQLYDVVRSLIAAEAAPTKDLLLEAIVRAINKKRRAKPGVLFQQSNTRESNQFLLIAFFEFV